MCWRRWVYDGVHRGAPPKSLNSRIFSIVWTAQLDEFTRLSSVYRRLRRLTSSMSPASRLRLRCGLKILVCFVGQWLCWPSLDRGFPLSDKRSYDWMPFGLTVYVIPGYYSCVRPMSQLYIYSRCLRTAGIQLQTSIRLCVSSVRFLRGLWALLYALSEPFYWHSVWFPVGIMT